MSNKATKTVKTTKTASNTGKTMAKDTKKVAKSAKATSKVSKKAPRAAKSSQNTIVELSSVKKTYIQGVNNVEVLQDVNLAINAGEMVGLVGPSGSGKSTLLHIIGLLDKPTSGKLVFKGQDISKALDKERTVLRRQEIGFIYQFHHLQPEFSALENVMIPQMIAGKRKKEAKEKATQLLTRLGLKDRLTHRPAALSGGEQQRVAIARALANDPSLLLADEPTGNLDHLTGEHVFEMLIEFVRDAGIGALVATHDIDLADRMDRVLEVKNGRLSLF